MKSEYITPVVTAFREDGSLDAAANEAIYEHLIRGRVSGIVIMGSLGEFFGLTMEQKKELIDIAAAKIAHRTKLIVGVTSMLADEAAALAEYAADRGADGVLAVSPYYFRLPDAFVEAYYSRLAENTRADIYLYNFPERTGYTISSAVTLRLAKKYKNIVGYKDTIGGMDHTRELINVVKRELPAFKIYSGFDENFAHNILAGGDGCIGGLSNIMPEVCAAWVEAFADEDMMRVMAIQDTIDQMMDIYGIAPLFIPCMKTAMKLRGLPIEDVCSFPIGGNTAAEKEKVAALLKKMKLI